MAGMDTKMDGPSNCEVMKRLEEGKWLPWRLVKHNTWMQLANKLDLPSPISNNDWKGLAEHLGFSTEDILVLESSKERRNTIALFTNYLPKRDASVNSVARALKQMNRDDALQILLDAVPDIEARYDADSHKSTLEAVEGEDTCVTNMAQGGCGCMGSSSLSCSSQHRPGGCSPCHHTHAHPHPHPHPHHHQHSHQCSVAASGCCCHHHVTSMLCHTPPVTCPSLPHQHPHHNGTGAGPSAACRAMGAGVQSKMVSHSFNISAGGGVHQETGYKPLTSSSGGREFYATPSLSPSSHHGAGSRLTMPQRSHPQSSPLRQLADLPQSYSQGLPESMVVHQDQDSPHHGALRSFLPDTGDDGPMEVDGEVEDEEPALLHTAIARGQGLVSMSMLNGRALPLEVPPDMGDDTPSTSLEELSSSDSSSRLPSLPLNVMRQVSEECNANQPFVPVTSSSKGRLAYGGGEGSGGAASPWGVNLDVTPGDVQRKAFSNTQAGAYANRESQSSLKHLEKLSHLPNRFKPDNKYTTMVAEQQMEEGGPSQRGGGRVHVKRERDSSRSCQFSGSISTRSGSSTSSRAKAAVGADTYPMRVKPQTGGTTVDQIRSRPPGALLKTTSVPIDMKVEEFKKAFRHIKVFVTYASDSKHHCRQVLSLCNCLDKNGFSCCVDVNARHDSPDQLQAMRDWCGRKFKEADFVLVCLSPLYMQEIRGSESSNSHVSSSSSNSRGGKGPLHTAYVYQLMQEEFQATRRCSRFVPLFMEGSAGVAGPSWLTSHLSYHWPRQYKDLLWMLTKPEDRIKQRSRTSPQNGHEFKVNGHHDNRILSSPFN